MKRATTILSNVTRIFGCDIVRIGTTRSYILFQGGMNQRQRENVLDEYLLEQHLASLLSVYRVNIVLDVGANQGQYAHRLRVAGYDGHIVSFEPIEELYEMLLSISQVDEKWTINKFALGSADGQAQLNVTSNALFSSFLIPNAQCEEEFGEECHIIRTERVEIQRLDSVLRLISETIPRPRIFLKMDTQGYDVEVFKGLGDYTNNVVALQSELAVVPLYEGMVRFHEAIKLYEAHGFEITALQPVNRPASLRLLEIDCVMARPMSSVD